MDYGHGGNITDAALKAGIGADEVIDFSASVAPLGPSPEALKAIKDAVAGLPNYPRPVPCEFIKTLSLYHSLPEGFFAAGNGSVELIYHLPRLFSPKKALIVEPAFSEYRRALECAGIEISSFMPEDGSYSINSESLVEEIASGDFGMIFIANPSNPLGTLTPHGELLRIIDACEEAGTILILDEAFADFNEDASFKTALWGYKKLVILRSMTKFFSLAGLRLGYLIAHPEVTAQLLATLPPWSVNSLASAAGTASLKDEAHISRVREWLSTEKSHFFEALSSIEGLSVIPSVANFFSIEIKPGYGPGSASLLRDELLSEGLLIRDLSNFMGFEDGSFFRVAVKNKNDNALLTSALSRKMKAEAVSI